MSLEPLLAWAAETWHAFGRELAARDTQFWILAFAPLVVFLEIPRYFLPGYALVLARLLGWIRPERAQRPSRMSISVVIAGRNEAATLGALVRTLKEQIQPIDEIIVVDDASDDGMERAARRLGGGLNGPRVRVIRNDSERGRTGKPGACNLGVRLARGEIVVTLDADSTIDRDCILNLVAPLDDPTVGFVAGNVLVRNADKNLLTASQMIEFAMAIDIRKRWTDLTGCTLQASGAMTAFRRSAVMSVGGWDPELAEDTDVSVRMVRAGWRLRFAPDAVAWTDCPETLRGLVRQRVRWDRGGFRTQFMRHPGVFNPAVVGWGYAGEMWTHALFSVVATFVYPVYMTWLLLQGLEVWLFVLLVSNALYAGLSLGVLVPMTVLTTRVVRPWRFVVPALVSPFLKGLLRWARLYAFCLELLKVKSNDGFLPDPVWANAPPI